MSGSMIHWVSVCSLPSHSRFNSPQSHPHKVSTSALAGVFRDFLSFHATSSNDCIFIHILLDVSITSIYASHLKNSLLFQLLWHHAFLVFLSSLILISPSYWPFYLVLKPTSNPRPTLTWQGLISPVLGPTQFKFQPWPPFWPLHSYNQWVRFPSCLFLNLSDTELSSVHSSCSPLYLSASSTPSTQLHVIGAKQLLCHCLSHTPTISPSPSLCWWFCL